MAVSTQLPYIVENKTALKKQEADLKLKVADCKTQLELIEARTRLSYQFAHPVSQKTERNAELMVVLAGHAEYQNTTKLLREQEKKLTDTQIELSQIRFYQNERLISTGKDFLEASKNLTEKQQAVVLKLSESAQKLVGGADRVTAATEALVRWQDCLKEFQESFKASVELFALARGRK